MNISIYKNRFGTSPMGELSILDYLDDIGGGRWQDHVLAVRTGKAKKEDAQGVTASATFKANRRADDMKAHSGFLAIDLDEQDNENLLDKRELLAADPHCFALHTSIRGKGLVFYVKIAPDKHKESFLALERHLANSYNVVVDPSGKDVSRFRFVSYDPDIYVNRKAKKWTQLLKKNEQPKPTPGPIAYHDDDIKHILDQIQGSGINIAEDYDSWLKISFALASEFGESGRSYFHVISSQSAKYDSKKSDRQYDIALKRDSEGISIATFFWYCEQSNIETKTPQTQEIEMLAKQRIKSGRTKAEAIAATKEYFSKMQGLPEERVNAIVDKVAETPEAAIKNQKVDDKTLEMELFVKSHNLRFNTITRAIELDEEPVTDRDLNSIYRQAMHAIDHSVNKGKLLDMIDSDLIPEFDPFKDFFKRNEGVESEGHLAELLECIEIMPLEFMEDLTEDEKIADYLDVFLTRWLVSIISAMHGTYSLLTLVLCGSQGSGKSKFFRGLLPVDLRSYYAESKLDKDKDDGILMCQKLILLDDEFSGKSKREAAKFKEISSRQTFTVRRPYGKVFEDLPRIAVLCGTTNDTEILNDSTGNRRLIPVNVKSIDIARFEAIDKTALFMELYRMWKDTGDSWMLGSKEIEYLKKATAANEEVSFEEALVKKYFSPSEKEDRRAAFMGSGEIKEFLDSRTKDRIDLRRLTAILKKLGFVYQRKMINGHQARGFFVRSHVDLSKPFTPDDI